MKKNVAGQKIGAQMVTASDGSAFTGSVTVYVTGDAGTQAVGSVGSGACTHEGNGYHTYAPAQAETNYDLVAFTFIGTGAIPTTVQIFTTFPQTGDNYARLGAPAGASVSADVAAVKSDTAAILVDTGTTLDAKIDAIDDYIDTEIAAIKAKTDNLPSDPADASDIASAFTTVNSKLDAIDDFIDTEVGAIKTVTDKLDDTLEDDGGTYRFTTNALEQAPTGGSAPSAADIADAVWDEAISGHATAGTFGKAAADTLADTNELQADWVNGGRLDNILDARASQASVDTVDGIVDAIKAVTDNLPDSGALTTLVNNVAAILVDTGTTLDAKLDAIDDYVDTEVAAILEDTGTTIPGLIAGLNNIAASDVWDEVTEGSYTASQCMKIIMASLVGKLSGVNTNTPKFRDTADSKDVISATVDATGRTSVTLNP